MDIKIIRIYGTYCIYGTYSIYEVDNSVILTYDNY